MTKWARMRKRKERKRAEEVLERSEAEGKEAKLVEPENIQHPQEIEKIEDAKTSSTNTILSQIPRYAYLLAFFALLAGVFVPLITYQTSFDAVIQGIATLFLGLTGAILLFKGTTSDKRRGIFIAIGFALIAISLALIFMLQEHLRT
jgi:VIT1/CCC1 family predicted Fe2+/Mn2+ transporter|tara:strand:- start:324 stop:764 length:441 start_codon:yes stop_codon:yes gene_type:complete